MNNPKHTNCDDELGYGHQCHGFSDPQQPQRNQQQQSGGSRSQQMNPSQKHSSSSDQSNVDKEQMRRQIQNTMEGTKRAAEAHGEKFLYTKEDQSGRKKA